jgi:hypothetical protein
VGYKASVRLSSSRHRRSLRPSGSADSSVGRARKRHNHNGWQLLDPVPAQHVSNAPPFPEFVSGHSAFSAAGATILKKFTGSDAFGDSVSLAAGSSKIEPGVTPSKPITLRWRRLAKRPVRRASRAGMGEFTSGGETSWAERQEGLQDAGPGGERKPYEWRLMRT